MVAEPARDQVPEWDGQANTLERFEEDVMIFTLAVPKERKVTIGPKLLQQFPKGSPEGDRLGTSEVGCAATGGRRHSVAEAHSTPSRKGLAARLFRTLQTFPSPFRASVSAVDATLHCRGIKLERTSFAGNQIRVSSEKRRTRDQRNHCRCVAWISSAGKRGTHRIRTSVCLWCCG